MTGVRGKGHSASAGGDFLVLVRLEELLYATWNILTVPDEVLFYFTSFNFSSTCKITAVDIDTLKMEVKGCF